MGWVADEVETLTGGATAHSEQAIQAELSGCRVSSSWPVGQSGDGQALLAIRLPTVRNLKPSQSKIKPVAIAAVPISQASVTTPTHQ